MLAVDVPLVAANAGVNDTIPAMVAIARSINTGMLFLSNLNSNFLFHLQLTKKGKPVVTDFREESKIARESLPNEPRIARLWMAEDVSESRAHLGVICERFGKILGNSVNTARGVQAM